MNRFTNNFQKGLKNFQTKLENDSKHKVRVMGLGYSQGQPIAAFWKLPNFPNSSETELKLIQHLSILRNSITTKVTYQRCQKSHI